MRNFHLFLITFLSLYAIPINAQTNFRTGWEASNPVEKGARISIEEKVKIHEDFLEKAFKDGDTLKQLYGYLYLTYDYFDGRIDYTQASAWLLKAAEIANASGNPGWQGWVVHRQAIVEYLLRNYDKARILYEQAAALCGTAKDSLCVAESLEQVSSMYGWLNDFENADRYHVIAMPLIKKFGGETQLGAALSNYAVILTRQKQHAKAIPYIEEAMAIFKKLGKKMELSKTMNNLADAHRVLGHYDRSIKILQECMRINEDNNFWENMIFNYANMHAIYDSLGDYHLANEYLIKYFSLRDSLRGAETQQKIAELQIKYESQQKELALEKSKSALEAANRSVERLTLLVFFVLLLAVAGIWRWWWLNRQAKLELLENRETLADMTRILIEKNELLAKQKALEEEEPSQGEESFTSPEDFEARFFEQHILTDADWASFKVYFERANPSYLHRLRSRYPGITDAEERLFLFIKLNLTSK